MNSIYHIVHSIYETLKALGHPAPLELAEAYLSYLTGE